QLTRLSPFRSQCSYPSVVTSAPHPHAVAYGTLGNPIILAGAGRGMFVAPNMSSIMNATPVTRRGVASGMSATLVTTGVLLSLSITFAIMATSIPLNTLQAIFAQENVGSTSSVYLSVGPLPISSLVM